MTNFRKDPKTRKNSLNLSGDGDEIDVIEAVEQAFGVRVENNEAEGILNVGDLFDLVIAKLGSTGSPKSCLSSKTYYRLRRSLAAGGGEADFHPSIRLKDFQGPWKYPRNWLLVEQETDLHILHPVVGLGTLVALISLALAISTSLSHPGYHIGHILFAICIFSGIYTLLKPAFGFPLSDDCTVSDLVKTVAAQNFGKLVRENGGYRIAEAWDAITRIIADSAECDLERIDRNTVFFDSQLPPD